MSCGPRYTPEEDRAILDAFTVRSVRIDTVRQPARSNRSGPFAAAIGASSTAAPLPLSRDPVTKRSP